MNIRKPLFFLVLTPSHDHAGVICLSLSKDSLSLLSGNSQDIFVWCTDSTHVLFCCQILRQRLTWFVWLDIRFFLIICIIQVISCNLKLICNKGILISVMFCGLIAVFILLLFLKCSLGQYLVYASYIEMFTDIWPSHPMWWAFPTLLPQNWNYTIV